MIKNFRIVKGLTRCLLGVVFVGIISGCVRSGMLTEGIHSFKLQDYRRAFVLLMPVAKAGNPDAQYAIGYMYYYAEGVVEDRKKAWFWISCAAKAGQPDAIVALKILEPWHTQITTEP